MLSTSAAYTSMYRANSVCSSTDRSSHAATSSPGSVLRGARADDRGDDAQLDLSLVPALADDVPTLPVAPGVGSMSTDFAWSGAWTAAWAKYRKNGFDGLDAFDSRTIEIARSQKSSVTK